MQYSLIDISTLELQTKVLPLYSPDQQIQVDFGHQFVLAKEMKVVQLVLHFHFRLGEETLGRIKTGFAFLFDDLSAGLDKNGELLKDLQRQLYAVAVGTTRGILHAKTEGNPGTKLIIPVLNPSEQIKD